MDWSSRWAPGTPIVYREVWLGKVWTARPVIVVQDTPDLVALYLSPGTVWKHPAGSREQYFDFLRTGEWALADSTWLLGDTLILLPPCSAHAVHVMWESGGRGFAGWYINLQDPIQRTAIGFDFMDLELDILVEPDLSRWTWKDEAHLQRALADGRFSVDQASKIRAEGERVIDRIRSRASPFNEGWETWVPPAGWSIPGLPQGWDRV